MLWNETNKTNTRSACVFLFFIIIGATNLFNRFIRLKKRNEEYAENIRTKGCPIHPQEGCRFPRNDDLEEEVKRGAKKYEEEEKEKERVRKEKADLKKLARMEAKQKKGRY